MNKKTWKKLLSLLLAAVLCFSAFAACGEKEDDISSLSPQISPTPVVKTVYKIGLVQYDTNSLWDSIREAFMKRIEEWGYNETMISIDYQSAEGDEAKVKSICDNFIADEVDIIVAISAPAAKAAKEAVADKEIKVLFAAVSDPQKDVGISDLSAPSENITGTSDILPVTAILDLALNINTGTKTVGLLYNPDDPQSVEEINKAKEYLAAKEIAVAEGTVATAADVGNVTKSLCEVSDIIFCPKDNIIEKSVGAVITAANEAKKPVYSSTTTMVEAGALGTVSVDYTELGAAAADMAVNIIEGKDINQIPIKTFSGYLTYINQNAVDLLEVKIPEDLKKTAVYITN